MVSQSVKVGLRQWGLRLSTILWFLGGLAFLFSLPLVIQASPLILLGILLIALSCAAVIAWFIERFLRTSHFRTRWLKASVAIIFLLTIIVASPIVSDKTPPP